MTTSTIKNPGFYFYKGAGKPVPASWRYAKQLLTELNMVSGTNAVFLDGSTGSATYCDRHSCYLEWCLLGGVYIDQAH